MSSFVIRTVTHGRHVVVLVVGDVDPATSGALRAELVELIDAGHTDLIVDLGDVRFIDSTGLGVLVGALKATRQHGGQLRLVAAPKGLVAAILRVSALDRVFIVHDTLEAALAS